MTSARLVPRSIYAACDLGDIDQTKAMLARIRRDLPPIRGIVHGAMVLDDVPVVGLDAARLDRVLRPKAWGAWNLSALTERDELDFFVLQSSIAAGTWGSPGNPIMSWRTICLTRSQRNAAAADSLPR